MALASLLVDVLLGGILVIIISVAIGMMIGLDPLISILSGFLIVACVLLVMYAFPDSTATFKSAVTTPVPRSVKLLQGKRSGFIDQIVWLHFTIHPEDLRQILTSQDCSITPYGRDRRGENPSWWKPEQLGEGAHIYKCVGKEWGKSLYVNATLTEVYHFASYTFIMD